MKIRQEAHEYEQEWREERLAIMIYDGKLTEYQAICVCDTLYCARYEQLRFHLSNPTDDERHLP